MGILEERGYQYDSSLFPTLFSPLVRYLDYWLSGRRRLPKSSYKLSSFFAPLSPYFPSYQRVFKKGESKILEVPVNSIPIFRFPFSSTFVLNFGLDLFRLGYFLTVKRGLPLNYLFHLRDLSDPIFDKRIPFIRGMSIPLKKKYLLCQHIIERISKDYQVLPTKDFASKIREQI